MSEVLFNFHDIILWMTAMQCLFFAVLLLATNSHKQTSTRFLAAFLFAHAFISLHELILWGAEFKFKVRDFWPQLYFLGGFAYYLDGALLFFCVKSLVFRDFALRQRDLLHLLPVVLFFIYMVVVFFRLPLAERLAVIHSEDLVYSWHYVLVEFLCKCLRVAYCLWSLRLMLQYIRLLKSTHSNVEKVDLTWMQVLVSGFLVVMSMEVVLSVAKLASLRQHYDLRVFEVIGLTGYYTLFMLINLLVFTGIRYFAYFEGVHQREKGRKPATEQILNPELASEIDAAMERDKPYLQPDITLDILAERLSMPARDLSMVINRHFGVNFYEFINRYRVGEACRLLRSEAARDRTITDIYLSVGFNSKSVFNTFFKKTVGMTPSQYRQAEEVEALPTIVPAD
ncbi:AraC family transcriptional regulator [Microbulbifer thermotolerans]|uniref:AraC family transcriptional regulator n=1 Tax=Microbulbifer thermotolerans TaxID=252514 RepID=UPI00224ADE4A|nr:helix-turn-helix domain-containing protein [Microbulbifer thermotolerans]MCX2834590.1 helix-turn-helix domain-containing protein [Microbulbifer thermotolerans]